MVEWWRGLWRGMGMERREGGCGGCGCGDVGDVSGEMVKWRRGFWEGAVV